jgi:hypothetical protein
MNTKTNECRDLILKALQSKIGPLMGELNYWTVKKVAEDILKGRTTFPEGLARISDAVVEMIAHRAKAL